MLEQALGLHFVNIQRTACLSISRASLACRAYGMASRHTFQNLVLTCDAWKCTAGRDWIIWGQDPQVTNKQWGTYPCLGAPNRERTIHGHILTLEDERLLLEPVVRPATKPRTDDKTPTSGTSFSSWNRPRHLSHASSSRIFCISSSLSCRVTRLCLTLRAAVTHLLNMRRIFSGRNREIVPIYPREKKKSLYLLV